MKLPPKPPNIRMKISMFGDHAHPKNAAAEITPPAVVVHRYPNLLIQALDTNPEIQVATWLYQVFQDFYNTIFLSN